jgi:hypothetical protein
VVVVVGSVHAQDVLVVDDVVLGSRRITRVVVVRPGCDAAVVVLDPLVVVVVVLRIVIVAQWTMLGVARQRRTSFVGGAPGSTAIRSRRVPLTGTVNVSVSHVAIPHAGTSNEQTPSHCPSTSQETTTRPARSRLCAIRPSRHERRTARAEASSALISAATTASMTSARPEVCIVFSSEIVLPPRRPLDYPPGCCAIAPVEWRAEPNEAHAGAEGAVAERRGRTVERLAVLALIESGTSIPTARETRLSSLGVNQRPTRRSVGRRQCHEEHLQTPCVVSHAPDGEPQSASKTHCLVQRWPWTKEWQGENPGGEEPKFRQSVFAVHGAQSDPATKVDVVVLDVVVVVVVVVCTPSTSVATHESTLASKSPATPGQGPTASALFTAAPNFCSAFRRQVVSTGRPFRNAF